MCTKSLVKQTQTRETLSTSQADASWASLLPVFPLHQRLPFLLLAPAPQIKEAMRVTPIIAGFPRVALQARPKRLLS